MLDENFVVSIYLFVIKIKCKLGIHEWYRINANSSHNHIKAASDIWYDADYIEFYECIDCHRQHMIWEDKDGKKHKVKVDK